MQEESKYYYSRSQDKSLKISEMDNGYLHNAHKKAYKELEEVFQNEDKSEYEKKLETFKNLNDEVVRRYIKFGDDNRKVENESGREPSTTTE